MAFGALLFSLPVALLGAVWARLAYGIDVIAMLGTYSAVGLMTMLTVLFAVGMASKSREKS